jgi:hypothetical protein
MPEIQGIGIGTVDVQSIAAPQVIPPPVLPVEPPITLMLGFPTADIPGGELPIYEPLDFTAGEHTHRTAPTPRLNPFKDEASSEKKEEKPTGSSRQPVPAPPSAVPFAADVPKVDIELPCPAPDAIPLGAKNKSQTAVIIGYEMVDGTCEQQLKPLDVPTVIGNYLPAAPLVTTTAAVAATATSAAIIARPLGDFLLKAVKPTVKKVIKKIKEKMGKQVAVESVFQRRKFQRSLRK